MIALQSPSFMKRLLRPRAYLAVVAFMLLIIAAIAGSSDVYATQLTGGRVLECLRDSPTTVAGATFDGLLSARAVACTYEMVELAKTTVVGAIASLMLKVAAAVIVLAFVLFGLRLTMMGGVQNPYGDAFTLIFKAGVVLFILAGMTSATSGFNLSNVAMGVQDDLIRWVSEAFSELMGRGNTQLLRECNLMQDIRSAHPDSPEIVRNYALSAAQRARIYASTPPGAGITIGGKEVPGLSVWITIDCLAGLLIGVAGGVIRDVGIFSMILAMLSSGPLGITCFVATITFLLTLLLLIIRSVFLVMQAYLTIAVILMFLPLVIPTIMFRRTYDYFARFLSMYTGIIFQPVIMIIFLGFAIQGIGIFLVGNQDDFQRFMNRTQRASSLTVNTNEIYSIWQVLMFDVVTNSADRSLLMDGLINTNPGKVIISAQGMAAMNMYMKYGGLLSKLGAIGNPDEPFGQETISRTNPVTGQVENVPADPTKQTRTQQWADLFGELSNTDFGDMVRMIGEIRGAAGSDQDGQANANNTPGAAGYQSFTLPFFDLRKDGKYQQMIEKLRRERGIALATPVQATDENGMPVYDADNNPVWQPLEENGEVVYEDDGVTPKIEYTGHHKWYAGAKFDSNFELWYMRKLFTAIIGLLLMTYIFFSLNDTIPDIARTITGSASYVMMGGGSGAFSNIPGGEMLQGMVNNTRNEWAKNFQAMAGDASNPQDRLKNFIISGKDALMKKGHAARNEHLGKYLHSIESQVTGKRE
jgi:type IV secretory pathway VirB6-like protein